MNYKAHSLTVHFNNPKDCVVSDDKYEWDEASASYINKLTGDRLKIIVNDGNTNEDHTSGDIDWDGWYRNHRKFYENWKYTLDGNVWNTNAWSMGMTENHTHKVRIYRINKDNPLPTQANSGDAGFDIYVSGDYIFEPGDKKIVKTGIIAEAPYGFHFKLCIRSSVAYKRGLRLVNSVGVIDNQFCGPEDEIGLLMELPPYAKEKVVLEAGERAGQLILERNEFIVWDEQEDRNFAGKSRGGVGSSGL